MNNDLDGATVVHVEFPEDLNWVELPDSFPYEIWTDPAEWAETMAFAVYYNGAGADAPYPDGEWVRATRVVIAEAQATLTGGSEQHKLLFFHDHHGIPIPLSLRYLVAEADWDLVLPLLVGQYDTENVEGPVIESFDVDGAEVGARATRHTLLDPDQNKLLMRVVYVWRRDGIDYQLQAAFTDLSAVRTALPAIEAFVRGMVTTAVE